MTQEEKTKESEETNMNDTRYYMLNLQQKLWEARKAIPALVKKRYSEDVDYEFSKIDDIHKFLTPALNEIGVNFDIIKETPTKRDEHGNPVYLVKEDGYWIYEADLTVGWVNVDRPKEKETAVIHVIGTHEMAEKAKGTAWTYGIKYYLLNKFSINQGGDDADFTSINPDPNRDGTAKDAAGQEKTAGASDTGLNAGSSKTAPKASAPVSSTHKNETAKVHTADAKMGTLKETNPASVKAQETSGNASGNAERKPNRESIRQEIAGNAAISSQAKDMRMNPGSEKAGEDTAASSGAKRESSRQPEKKEAKNPKASPVEEKKGQQAGPTEAKAGRDVETEGRQIELSEALLEQTEAKNQEQQMRDRNAAVKKDIPETSDGFMAVTDEDEVPFSEEDDISSKTQADTADGDADDAFLQSLQEEMDAEECEDDASGEMTIQQAKAVICTIGAGMNRPMGELLNAGHSGYKILNWIVNRYHGTDERQKEAARILLDLYEEQEKTKAA